MMLGETNDHFTTPGDGPAEWRKYVKYPLAAGLTAVSLAAVIGVAADNFGTEAAKTNAVVSAIRVLLTIGGLIAMGLAVWLRPKAVPVLALACATCLVARLAFPIDWDSGRIVAGLLTIFTGIGAVLMALPQTYRRVGVTFLILFHFASIATAVTSPTTYNYPTPWTTQAATAYLFRPYAQSLYLINAYHFYSPDPGAASQVWFCITYADPKHSVRWHKLPRRPEDMVDPLALEYYRRLSLTQQLEQYQPMAFAQEETTRRRRQREFGTNGIPMHPELTLAEQYRPASENVRLFLIPSYVRHVARLGVVQHEDIDPTTGKPYAISTIKVYRVDHRILLPQQFMAREPYAPDTYLPFYQGEYDRDGNATDPNDPLLFWLIPIYYERIDRTTGPSFDTPKSNPEKFRLIDGIKNHTGSDHNLK